MTSLPGGQLFNPGANFPGGSSGNLTTGASSEAALGGLALPAGVIPPGGRVTLSAPLSPASTSSCSSLPEQRNSSSTASNGSSSGAVGGSGVGSSGSAGYPQSPDRIRDAFLANRLTHQMFPPMLGGSQMGSGSTASTASCLLMTPPSMQSVHRATAPCGTSLGGSITCTSSSSNVGPTSAGGSSSSSSSSNSLLITPPTNLNKPTNANTAKDGKNAALDYSRYIRRYPSSKHCGNNYCKDLNYREHYHCLDCNFRVFVKKEEMVRHFKWHKKRDESLQYGFLRYSPSDDCSVKFPDCVHNRKQTHYHCMHDKCDKCYISTSDVQMHSNYHRKDIAIIQEGFQRFRATECCETPACAFYGQRTTHFHCIRDNCSTTFKNKADIEKHKTYHIKDEQLAKDGFRKFLKHEACVFAGCRFHLVCNHIHCIRPGCNYVLQSSGQLYSHKRKHERQDSELAYRKIKMAQVQQQGGMLSPGEAAAAALAAAMPPGAILGVPGDLKAPDSPPGVSQQALQSRSGTPGSNGHNTSYTPVDTSTPKSQLGYGKSSSSIFGSIASANSLIPVDDEDRMPILADDDTWTRFMNRYPVGDVCKADCDLMYREHYHCITDNCTAVIQAGPNGESREANEHAASHEYQDRITQSFFHTVGKSIEADCTKDFCPYYLREKHYHCIWPGCKDIVSSSDPPFKRLEHFKFHDLNDKNAKPTKEELLARTPCAVTGDGNVNFPKKRGRPAKLDSPKVAAVTGGTSSPLATPVGSATTIAPVTPLNGQLAAQLQNTMRLLAEGQQHQQQQQQQHQQQHQQQQQQQVHMQANADDSLGCIPRSLDDSLLSGQADGGALCSVEGFDVFRLGGPCPDELCAFSECDRHFHCTVPRCHYATNREDILELHSKDFHDSIDIGETYEFYDRSVDCRRQNCESNRRSRHFHCTRDGCDFSFVRVSAISAHDATHASQAQTIAHHSAASLVTGTGSPSPGAPLTPVTPVKCEPTVGELSASQATLSSPEDQRNANSSPFSKKTSDGEESKLTAASSSPDQSPQAGSIGGGSSGGAGAGLAGMVKSAGIFFPLSALHKEATLLKEEPPSPLSSTGAPDQAAALALQQQLSGLLRTPESGDASSILQSPRFAGSVCLSGAPLFWGLSGSPQATAAAAQGYMHGMLSLGDLSQAASPLVAIAASNLQQQQQLPTELQLHHQLANSAQSPLAGTNPEFLYGVAGGVGNVSAALGEKRTFPFNSCAIPSPPGSVATGGAKRPRSNPSAARPERPEEPVPPGYAKFRFNEDCRHDGCNYREHQTHFHCERMDCGYSFCDKTRFSQHSARHDRLDSVMGSDFRQFRAGVSCGRQDCTFGLATQAKVPGAAKASHYHCSKCDFVCSDTNKVAAHRKQHAKLDSVAAAGFEKFGPPGSGSRDCPVEGCAHAKQTHYHCLICRHCVLGLAQMSAHKYKHLDEQQSGATSPDHDHGSGLTSDQLSSLTTAAAADAVITVGAQQPSPATTAV
ncbi:zinc finger protein castor homolog 1-like isoform X3 [Varroa destructor]|nr:zinc finger protein castor homolog 1-like isoform X3 [Varroa destructor]